MRRLWRRLPSTWRAQVWRGLDRLGAWPVRIAAGPAAGLSILAPAGRRRAYRAGSHERPLLDLLAERLQPGMEFVDAGAFLGYFTLAAAARVGPGGRVWAFEPAAGSRRLLERSVRRNRLTNVTVVPRALGASVGAGDLSSPPNPSMARLVDVAADLAGTAPVEVTTLDAWCEKSGARPQVVKVDVEGAELDLLRGATRMLRTYRPLLIIEAHSAPDLAVSTAELVEWLRVAGYRVTPLAAGNGVDLAAALERLTQRSVPPGWVAVLHLLATPS